MRIRKQKPYKTLEVGGYRFDFYMREGDVRGTYLKISTESGILSLKISGNTFAYGYLLESLNQNNTEYLHGYAVIQTMVANAVMMDVGFHNDVCKAINKYMKRLDKEAEKNAKNVTETEDELSEALMNEAIKRGYTKDPAKAEKESREEMRKITSEDNLNLN